MSDNLKTDKHVYLVTVFTGLSRNSGTTSNVSFVIASLLKDTGVRHLTDGVKKVPPVTSSLQPILKSLQYIQIEQGLLFCARLHVYFLAGFYLQYTCLFFLHCAGFRDRKCLHLRHDRSGFPWRPDFSEHLARQQREGRGRLVESN